MSIHQIALIAGFFAAPAWLAWYGHRMRALTKRARAAFWGGIIGNAIAVIVLTIAVLLPPEQWQDAGVRAVVVYWSLLAFTVAGAIAGVLTRRT
jgi:hypothetical protein